MSALAALLLALASGDLACPAGTTHAGEAPPAGLEEWCERPDAAGRPRRHGPSLAWYDDGGLRQEAHWRDGQLPGAWVVYHRGRRKAEEGAWDAGEREGRWTFWYASGVREEVVEYRRGVRHGPFASWYPDGRRKAEGRFCGGFQCGRWTTWGEDGGLLGSEEYAVPDVPP